MPGPKKDIVEQVELYMKGKKPLIPLSVHTGVPFIAFLAVTLTLYVGAGVPIGARRFHAERTHRGDSGTAVAEPWRNQLF